MQNFQYKMPTKIIFGVGIRKQLVSICQDLNAKKIFILTGPNIVKTEIFKSIKDILEESDLQFEIYSDIMSDPPIDVVQKASEALKNSQSDLVVAIGGGSSIDTAKAICMLQTNEGSIKEYLFGGSKTVKNPCMPLICMPTTAGSGSEMSAASVITDKENRIKLSVAHDYMIPKVALIDPELHIGMPQQVTASTGMDALTHAIEAYVSLNANPLSDMNALYAIKTIGENLRTAVSDGKNIEARSHMAVASSIAGTAFLNGGLGVVHGIAQAMGGVGNVSHGVANSLILPYAMERNFVGNLNKFKNIAIALGENVEGLCLRDAAFQSVKAVYKLAKDIGIPSKLKDVGITQEQFPKIIKGTMEYRLLPMNPCQLNEKDIEKILLKAYE